MHFGHPYVTDRAHSRASATASASVLVDCILITWSNDGILVYVCHDYDLPSPQHPFTRDSYHTAQC